MSENEIKAAMSPEEWENADDVFGFESDTVWAIGDSPREDHIIAALALHGQPFGFTWEDVDHLRYMAQGAYDAAEMRWHTDEMPIAKQELERAYEIIDRIAALLPPRQP